MGGKCEVCKGSLDIRNKSGVCILTAECAAENHRRRALKWYRKNNLPVAKGKCEVCGGTTRWGDSLVCQKTAACRKEYRKRYKSSRARATTTTEVPRRVPAGLLGG